MNDSFVIFNSELRLLLEPKNVINRIIDSKANLLWCLDSYEEVGSFFLIKKGDEWVGANAFSGSITICDPDKACWKGEYEGVIATINLRLNENTVVLQLEIENNSSRTVDSLVLPRLVFGAERDLETGTFVWPFQNGALIRAEEFDVEESINLIYPVYASMQWMQYYGYSSTDGKAHQHGIYLACNDTLPYFKILRIGKKQGIQFMEFEFPGLQIEPGELWRTPECVIAVCDSDWRWGARFYGKWAHTWIEDVNPPDWHADNPVMHGLLLKEQFADKPRMVYNEIPDVLHKYKKYGVETLNIVGWIEGGHDSEYPDYVPATSMGGTQGLRDAIAAIHDEGGFAFLYTNGRLLSFESSVADKIPDWSVKSSEKQSIQDMLKGLFDETTSKETPGWNPGDVLMPSTEDDPSLVLERWGKASYAVACPSALDWQERFVGYIESLMKECAPDGFQVDQVAGCWAYICFDKNHRHTRPSEAWSFYKKFSEVLQKRVKENNPDCFVWTEGVCDVIGTYYDAEQFNVYFDSILKGKGTLWPFIYRYSFPERIIYSHANSRDVDLSVLAFLLGGGFFVHIGEPSVTSESFLVLLKCLKWRRRYSTALRRGPIDVAVDRDRQRILVLYRDDTRLIVVAGRVGKYINLDAIGENINSASTFDCADSQLTIRGLNNSSLPKKVVCEVISGEKQVRYAIEPDMEKPLTSNIYIDLATIDESVFLVSLDKDAVL